MGLIVRRTRGACVPSSRCPPTPPNGEYIHCNDPARRARQPWSTPRRPLHTDGSVADTPPATTRAELRSARRSPESGLVQTAWVYSELQYGPGCRVAWAHWGSARIMILDSSSHRHRRPKRPRSVRRRRRRIALELHREAGSALAHGIQAARVTEHVDQRHLRVEDDGITALGTIAEMGTPQSQIADDAIDQVLCGRDFDLHDRLEQYRPRLLQRFTERQPCGGLEGLSGRLLILLIPGMEQGGLDVDHRKASDDTGSKNALDPSLDAQHELLRESIASDSGFESVADPGRVRLDPQPDSGK